MITLLRKLFVRNYLNVGGEQVRLGHAKLAAVFGIITNIILVALKLTFAFWLASQNSWILPMALIGDSINNLSDMASCIVTLIGFSMSAKPADEDHPFGHERIEYVVGIIVAITVVVVAIELFRDSLTKVFSGELVQYDLITIVILGISVVIKLFQGYVYRGLGKAIGSLPLKATSLDSLTDAMATSLIMISAILSLILHWNFLDGYMGMAVSVFIVYSGIMMIKESIGPLIGEAADKKFVKKIVTDVKKNKGIYGVHDVICHSYGPTKYFVSLHAEVDQNKPILESHDLIDNIEAGLRKKYGIEITIHLDPIAINDPETDKLREEVREELATLSPRLKYHDFRIVSGPTHVNMIFDIVLPFDDKNTEQSIRAHLEHRFAGREKAYHFVVHFDRPFDKSYD